MDVLLATTSASPCSALVTPLRGSPSHWQKMLSVTKGLAGSKSPAPPPNKMLPFRAKRGATSNVWSDDVSDLRKAEWYHQPDEHAKVWRYMSFSKYVGLISANTLHFSRADTLPDPFEGARGAGPIPEDYHPPRSTLYNSNKLRLKSFVNCWYQEQFEIMAMWHIYGRPEDSVAIVSTFGQLRRALPRDVLIGSVNYINYRRPPVWFNRGMETMFCKHRALGFEHELRALKESNRRPKEGLDVKTDLSRLITSVYLAPASPNWFKSVVTSVTNQYGLGGEMVRRSSLDKTPIYNIR